MELLMLDYLCRCLHCYAIVDGDMNMVLVYDNETDELIKVLFSF